MATQWKTKQLHILYHFMLIPSGIDDLIELVCGNKRMSELLLKGKTFCRAGVAKWYTVPRLLRAARTVVGLSLEPPSMLANTSAGMSVKKA